MKEELESLKFSLIEKEDKLKSLSIDTFTYNPEINVLTKEISELKDKIKELEEEFNG